jgi:UDP-N-acetylmuramate dehydrogenase
MFQNFNNDFSDLRAAPQAGRPVRFNEPLSGHTSFRIGGPAAVYVRPAAQDFVEVSMRCIQIAKNEGLPFFVLGSGANVLAPDEGFDGVVLDTLNWSGGEEKCLAPRPVPQTCPSQDLSPARPVPSKTCPPVSVTFRSGTPMNEAVFVAAGLGLTGLEDFAGLPGTVGGAVYMNARAWTSDVSANLAEVVFLDEMGESQKFAVTDAVEKKRFGYKKSPFQEMPRTSLILYASFLLQKGDIETITRLSAERMLSRVEKHHFDWPSCGSVFKNNHDFGRSTGKIIDKLGLRGTVEGGAQISPWHGNFIINRDGASAADVRRLITLCQTEARKRFGFELECEVLFL